MGITLSFPLNIDHYRKSFVVSNAEERIKITGISPDLALSVVKSINENEGKIQSADLREERDPRILAFLDTLEYEGLVNRDSKKYITGKELSVILTNLYKVWNQGLFSHRLWTSLVDGTAKASVVDGWLIESYHFIRGANARLCYASSLCSDERIRSIFAHHYAEEYDHYKFFAESLRLRNISPEHVDGLGPLPTTLAVLNMARRAARIDPLAYAACSGLLESTGSDASKARSFYLSVERMHDTAQSGFVKPMLKHIDLDEEYEHGSVMADVFIPIEVIDICRADLIFQTVCMFKETLSMWFADIERYYFQNQYRPGTKYRYPYSNQPK